ncbi:MAG: WGR domain-containing protein [Planctomycetes bacterium]|nr:WGR domain-containing protein [Planctomycetota bacterium]
MESHTLAAADPPSPTAGASRYFEFVSDRSSKFWEITVSGKQHSVRFGRIGTAGQERSKSFETEAGAQNDAERLLRQKTGKGYLEKPRPE